MLRNSARFLHRLLAPSRAAACNRTQHLMRFLSSKKTEGEEEDAIRNHPDVKSTLEEMQQHFTEDDNTDEKTNRISKYLQEKFVLYRDQEAEVILDVHEELERIRDYDEESTVSQMQEEHSKYQDLNLKRGVSGVFDVDDLVQVLRSENAVDICVIQVPKELGYTDNLVLVSGRSPRHLKAIVQFVNKMYKRKKNKKDHFLKIQGDGSDWQALDMGNIVLHVMMPNVRHKYDIETLWAVGEKYDRLSNQPEKPIFDVIQKHLAFLQEMQPISNENKSISPSKN